LVFHAGKIGPIIADKGRIKGHHLWKRIYLCLVFLLNPNTARPVIPPMTRS
jgi:hypothetical protein